MSTLESILSEVESRGITLEPNGNNLDIVGPEDALTENLLQELKTHKVEILHVLRPNLHGCSIVELKGLAGEEWTDIETDEESLEALAYTVATRRLREQGIVPDDYTSIIICEQCGSVPMWEGFPKESNSCVWCFNRISGKPVPNIQKACESQQGTKHSTNRETLYE